MPKPGPPPERQRWFQERLSEQDGLDHVRRLMPWATFVKRKELRRQVTALEANQCARSDEVPEAAKRLQAEYADARQVRRTAATHELWHDDRVTQVAAAWVLGTVFVRYCEDNDLIDRPFIAGPGEQFTEAKDRHEAHFCEHPHHSDHDWIITAFDHSADAHPTAAGLLDNKRDDARIGDDRDEREHRFYTVIDAVDIPTDQIRPDTSWRHATETFGVDFCRTAMIRRINVGPARFDRHPQDDLAGQTVRLSPFHVCSACGAATAEGL